MNPINIMTGLKKNYIIPCFQREYAWGEEEIEGLINGIKEVDDDFCLGVVTVKRSRDGYRLIDGQQRLTTLYLIAICCGVINEPYKVRLTSEYEDLTSGKNNFVNILEKKFDNVPRKLQDGYRIIEKLIPEAEKTNFCQKFAKVYYYEVNLDANTDLNHYFEVMNSRGVQLSRSDIVKSLIMNKLEDDGDKKRLNRLWYKFEKMDSSNNVRLFKQIRVKGSEYRTINEILGSKNTSQETAEPEASEEESSILNFEFFLLYVVRLYRNLDDDDLDSSGEFNLSDLVGEYEALLRDKDSDAVIKFLDFIIEIKDIYNKYIVKYDNATETWTLNASNNDMLLIQSCLRVSYTNRRIMHWIYMTLKFFYKNRSADTNSYVETMRNYIRDQEVTEFLKSGKKINYRTGFSTPNIVLNYLDFLILNNYPDIQKQIPEAKGLKINKFKFKFRNSIEHFMPRHAEDGTENPAWVDDFGNLALLSYKTNTRIQNEDPKGKAQHFEREGLSGYSLKLQIMSKFALEPTGWNQTKSDLLTKTMIQLLEDDVKKLAL